MGRGAGREAVGSGAAQAGMQTGKVRPQGLGVRARAGRTSNMFCMFVTLEVSQLSGWLNADANCRESKGGHTVRGEVYGSGGGRWKATAVLAACRGGSTGMQIWGRARGRAHVEHVVHFRDAGGVEAQGLVERRRVPEHARHGCDAGDVKAQWLIERRRALKHAVHVRDA